MSMATSTNRLEGLGKWPSVHLHGRRHVTPLFSLDVILSADISPQQIGVHRHGHGRHRRTRKEAPHFTAQVVRAWESKQTSKRGVVHLPRALQIHTK